MILFIFIFFKDKPKRKKSISKTYDQDNNVVSAIEEDQVSINKSQDLMNRMSADIDFSNQRVQETIEFLSQPTFTETSNTETPRKDNETSKKFAENLAYETIEDAKLIIAVSQKNDITVNALESSTKIDSEMKDKGHDMKNEEGDNASMMQCLSLSKPSDDLIEDNPQNDNPESSQEPLVDVYSLTSNDVSVEFLSKTNEVLKALDNPDTALPKEESDLLKSLLSFDMNDLMPMKNFEDPELSIVNKAELNVGSFDKLEDDEIKTETCTENNEISEISSNRCDENTDEAQENNSVDKTSEKSFMKDQENMSDKICDKDDDSRAESGTELSEDENSRKCVDNIEEVQLNHLSDYCYKKNFMDDQGKEASIPDRNCDKVEDGKADIFENIEDIQENNLSDKSLENNFTKDQAQDNRMCLEELADKSSNECNENIGEAQENRLSDKSSNKEDDSRVEMCPEELADKSSNECNENIGEAEENNLSDKSSEKNFMKDQAQENRLSDKSSNKEDDSRVEMGHEELADKSSDECNENIGEAEENNLSDKSSEKNFVKDQVEETFKLDKSSEKNIIKDQAEKNGLSDKSSNKDDNSRAEMCSEEFVGIDKDLVKTQEVKESSKKDDDGQLENQMMHCDEMIDRVILDDSKNQDLNTHVMEWLNKSSAQNNEEELKNKKRINEENEKLKKLERTFSYEIDRCRDNVKDIQETFLGNQLGSEDNLERPGVLSDDDMPGLLDTGCENEKISETAAIEVENTINECKKMERSSESRMSLKKRKNKNSLRNNPGAENGCQLSEENKRKSKSIEMFDYYVNSIDEIKTQEGEKYPENEKIKIDAQERKEIESLLITTPTDMTHDKHEATQEYSEEPDFKGNYEKANC